MKPESNNVPYEFYLDGEPTRCGQPVPEVTAQEISNRCALRSMGANKKAPAGWRPRREQISQEAYRENTIIIPRGRSICKGVFW